MKITIVTISYNQGLYLEHAIRSVIEQKYPDLEYIVIDPGSSDSSRKIINKYRSKITKVIFEPDLGPADGLNKGFSYASGDIYGYLNADDMYLEGTLSKVNRFFTDNNNSDVVSSHGYVIDENNSVLHKVFSNKFNLKHYLAGCCVLVQQSTFFLSNTFKSSSGFNIENKINWDGELMADFANEGAQFRLVNDYWSFFRVYNGSITGSGKYLEDAKKQRKNIQIKYGYNNINILQKNFYWLISKIFNPTVTALRIIDGIKYPVRLV